MPPAVDTRIPPVPDVTRRGRPASGRPTIRDVAKACGVSEATVSYALNGKAIVKESTKERVLATMREMNYYPSAVARGLSNNRVQTLGIAFGAVDSIEFMTNAYASGLLQGIMLCARHEAFHITLFTMPWQDAATSTADFNDRRTDGILVVAPRLDTDIVAGLSAAQIPLVAISAEEGALVPNVDVDNRLGVRLAMEHLVGLGHRRIAYLTGNDDLASYRPRREAYLTALADAGIAYEPRLERLSRFDGSLGYEQTLELLRSENPPTAILAGNDAIALRSIAAARALGLDVPLDLSVVGFDDAPAALLVAPALTTVHQPLQAIGETATRLLLEQVREGRHEVPETRLLPPELVVRGTTGAPKP